MAKSTSRRSVPAKKSKASSASPKGRAAAKQAGKPRAKGTRTLTKSAAKLPGKTSPGKTSAGKTKAAKPAAKTATRSAAKTSTKPFAKPRELLNGKISHAASASPRTVAPAKPKWVYAFGDGKAEGSA